MKDFLTWMFKKKDIDSQIIALLIAGSLAMFLEKFTEGVINPLVSGLFKIDEDSVQEIGPFKFKFHMLVAGIVNTFIILFIVYRLAILSKLLNI